MKNIRKAETFVVSGHYLKKNLKLHFDISPEDYELINVFCEDHFTRHIILTMEDVIYLSEEESSEFNSDEDKIARLLCTIIRDKVPVYTEFIIIETRK